MGKIVYTDRDLSERGLDILKGVGRAILACAFRLRDNMRTEFINAGSMYKHRTEKYDRLAKGIMVGKLSNGFIKIHALGGASVEDSWKVRFFVAGTRVRENKGKPYTKGFIKKNDAVEKGLADGQQILDTYIKNALK